MSKKNNFIWKAIQTICWLIFAGYSVQTGALLFNLIYSLFNPAATHNLHLGLDLSQLYSKSQSVYVFVFSLIISVSALKAFVFYIVLKLFKKLNLVKPFSENVSSIISKITYYAFAIGIISFIAQRLIQRLIEKGYNVGVVERYWDDGGVYLMMSAILFVITLIFQRGIELQKENDLTV
ncbi:DUF2975 domain-containing protein [Ignavibacterium sp.]|uniref:DUF2975 domain-containing protein n=1 Tax=Ignavibacterium sp. TaxID=2651167 RepID=UPI00307EC39C